MPGSDDSDEQFEDEELSSSECNSGEEESAYSQNEADIVSQDGSIKPDQKFNSLADGSKGGIKLPPKDDVSNNERKEFSTSKPGNQSGAAEVDSDDSDMFD